ncbi:MAG: SDR family NAD(P)-dependent oxidoreductase, partial [Gammaproteobacteria bacterium]|nr:SDR family NAD(P)-dependent oxidoreductase [Gammaproteobacteria bacterium]
EKRDDNGALEYATPGGDPGRAALQSGPHIEKRGDNGALEYATPGGDPGRAVLQSGPHIEKRDDNGALEYATPGGDPGRAALQSGPGDPLRQQGVYLITGGLGGLGILFAEHLARFYKAKLILAGRSALTPDKEKQLAALKQMGAEVRYLQADISQSAQAAELFKRIKEEYAEINGILHTAGVIADALLVNKNREQLLKVITPKVAGAINIDQASQDEPLDFMVFFSSMAALMGNPGQTDYAFANAFMDQYAYYREGLRAENKRHGRTLSVNWPLWHSGGMQVDQQTLDWLFDNTGIRPLQTDAGIEALLGGLRQDIIQFAVVQGDTKKLAQGFGDTAVSVKPAKSVADIRQQIDDALLTEVSAILKVEAADIDLDEEISNYGFDAINLTDLTDRLNQQFNLDLTPAVLFEHPSLADFSSYLSQTYKAAVSEESTDIDTPDIETEPLQVSEESADIEAPKIETKPLQTSLLIGDALLTEVSAILKVEAADIDLDEEMSNYGFDSINLTDLTNRLNQRFGLELTPAVLFEHPSLAEFSSYLSQAYEEQFAAHFNVSEKSADIETPEIETLEIETAPLQAPSGSSYGSRFLSPSPPAAASQEPVAIIGMAGVMPGSADLDSFWQHLQAGDDLIQEVPASRWDWKAIYGDAETEGDKTFAKWGGFIEGIDRFDASFFGISPAEAELMDPQQRLFLQTVWHALEDAGIRASDLSGSQTGLFAGVATRDYNELVNRSNLPIQAHLSTGVSHSILANRISYLLNWHGPSEAIDTACSSSLAAIHRAVIALQQGECDLALAGGVNMMLSPVVTIAFSKAGMLAQDGRCKTFDNQANGYVRGEGVGAIVLKPLAKAKAAGDPIIAVIRGTAENHGGHANSLTAPNPNAQAEVLIKAYTKAQIPVETVSYIEAHGTGTSLGDPIEINGLKKAFEQLRMQQETTGSWCGLGSVKTNIGHLETAAGIAGVLKVLLAMQHQTLPRTLHFKQQNRYIDLKNSPFYIVDKKQPWTPPEDTSGLSVPRRAGVSSFGFGGSNAHVVLEQYPHKAGVETGGKQLIVLSAKNTEGLQRLASLFIEFLEKRQELSLAAIAWTLQSGREAMEARLALAVSTTDELIDKLKQFVSTPAASGANLHFAELDRVDKNAALATADLQTIVQQGQLDKLADLWVNGAAVAWQQLHTQPPQRISLPGYPFADERHWISEPQAMTYPLQPSSSLARLHPLLESNTSTLQEQKFTTRFSGDEFYLNHHRVGENKVLPGAACLEMARAAGEFAGTFSGQDVIISDIIWAQAITVALEQSVDISLFPNNAAGIDYEISSTADNTRIIHGQGRLLNASAANRPADFAQSLDIDAVRTRCPQTLDKAECYRLFEQQGLNYGPSFQVITQLNFNDNEVLTRLQLPDSVSQEAFKLHPSLLDGALQSIVGLLAKERSNRLFLPFSLSKLWMAADLTSPCYAWVRYREKADQNEHHFDIQLVDENGAGLLLLQDFALRAIAATASAVVAERAEQVVAERTEQSDDQKPSELAQKTENYLKSVLAAQAKLKLSKIDSRKPLETYGIDSVLIMSLTRSLEKQFGSLSKTLFFEYQTIQELSGYFIENHHAALSALLGTASEKTPDVAADVLPDTQTIRSISSRSRFVSQDISTAQRGDIAIIGVSGRYPMADNIDEFWQNLKSGKDCISEIPKERWNHQLYFDADKSKTDKTYSKWGGFINDVDAFDPLFFQISAKEAQTMDPQERLFLETVYHSLEDAGYMGRILERNNRVGVFVGAMWGHYQLYNSDRSSLPNSAYWAIANRISYAFNFSGPSIAVDTACSSSLTAIHLACESLQRGESRVAIAGGVNVTIHPDKYVLLSQSRFTASDGRCRSFGAGGDGYVPGEGVGAVVLKPLAEAKADGDRIYAVIKGSSLNHGGKTNGFSVPNPNAQARLIKEALAQAQVDPRSINYLEAHGTGTPLGDPIEITGLSKAFEETWQVYHDSAKPARSVRQYCAIGSVKSNIGHLESAAGVAAVTKVLLQMRHKQLAPSIHSSQVNPHIDFSQTPFYIQQTLSDWNKLKGQAHPRRAGVSSFGAGGSNAHIILEEYQQSEPAEASAQPQIIILSAANRERLEDYTGQILSYLKVFSAPALLEPVFKQQLKAAVARVLLVAQEEIDDNEQLVQYGFEPVKLTDLSNLLQEHFSGLELTPSALTDYPTLNQLADYLFSEYQAGQKTALRAKTKMPGLADIAFTLQAGRKPLEERLALAVSDLPELITKLSGALQGSPDNVYRGNIHQQSGATELLIEGEEGKTFIRQILQQRKLDKLAQLWVAGVSMDWSLLHEHLEHKPRCISLPHYPFARERYWVDASAASGRQTGISRLHPLLGANTSDFQEQKFTTLLNSRDFYLSDHSVAGESILPAVACLEMARAAGALSANRQITALSDTVWIQPVIVGESKNLDIRLYPENNRIRYEISSDEPSTLHAQGQMSFAEKSVFQPQVFELDAIRQRCTDVIEAQACYRLFEQQNIRYGQSFRPIQKILRNKQEVLSHLRLPVEVQSDFTDYTLHPSLMDGALQSVVGLLDTADPDSGPVIPFSMGQLHILAKLPEQCYAYVQPVAGKGTLKQFNIHLLDENGQSCVMIENFAVRALKKVTPIMTETEAKTDEQALDEQGDVAEKSLHAKTETYLASLLAKVSKIGEARISTTKPLEEYGIDSVMILSLTQELEKQFSALSKTLFFEYRTLSELADYFLQNHHERLSAVLGDDAAKPAVVAQASLEQIPRPRAVKKPSRFTAANSGQAEPIAIIGVSGRYPMADNLQEYWDNLKSGRDCISEIPADRWDHQLYFDTDKDKQKKSYSKWGGFIDGVKNFDPLFFRMSAKEAELIDPQERLFLQTVYHTLEDAGYTPDTLEPEQRVGVFVGIMWGQYQLFGVNHDRLTPSSAYWSVANRISYNFNFRGPSMAVDTACSSSLTAIHLACESIRRGESAVAFAGGVNVSIHPEKYLLLSQNRFTSTDGRCRSFGEGGDGYVPGEGVGAVLLKPLRKAEADGDHIYAVIKGSAVNHGGRTNGYTVPDPNAQAEVVSEALQQADIDPRSISYVEAHGTGTSLGDPIEITGLNKAFSVSHQNTNQTAIGSAKSNIGHLESAAGIAGVTKVLLQLQHRMLAPSLHSGQLNPHIDFTDTPFHVQQKLAEWVPATLLENGIEQQFPRRAGISSFGAGGANAHIILEEYQQSVRESAVSGPCLILLSARNKERLQVLAGNLSDFVQGDSSIRLADIAYTLQIGREELPQRLAMTVTARPDLLDKLQQFIGNPEDVSGKSFYQGDVGEQQEKNALSADGKRDLEELARLWASGAEINWQLLYGDDKPRRIALPGYPFAQNVCWLPLPARTVTGVQQQIHPLVQVNSSTLSEQKFSATLHGSEFYLSDHRLGNDKTLPGAAYLEMARAAGALAAEANVIQLKNIIWAQPIIVTQPVQVEIGLYPQQNSIEFEVFSRQDEQRKVHCQGQIVIGEKPAIAPTTDINAVLQRCPRSIEKTQCYQYFQSNGLHYGPAFQVIELIHCNDREVLAELSLPSVVEQAFGGDGQLHPSLLDGALQSIIGLLIDKKEALLPFALDEINLLGNIPGKAYAYVRYSSRQKRSGARFDIQLLDSEGKCLITMNQFALRVLQPSSPDCFGNDEGIPETSESRSFGNSLRSFPKQKKQAQSADTLYFEPYWRETPLLAAGQESLSVLLLTANQTLAGQLSENGVNKVLWVRPAENYQEINSGEICLDFMQESHFALLLESLNAKQGLPTNIVYFIDESVSADDPQGINTLLPLFYLAKALIKTPGKAAVRILSAGFFETQSAASCLAEALAGFSKTLQLENPRLIAKTVTMDCLLEKSSPAALISRELQDDAWQDKQIRYDENSRKAKEYRTFTASSADRDKRSLKKQGVYLITGGLGGLGLIFADYLARHYQARLVLTGRSELSEEKSQPLDSLKQLGAEVLYIAADVADQQAATQLIARTKEQYGALNGILHSAGVLADAFILRKTGEQLNKVLSPKVAGAVYLDQAARDEPLDLFILFSSIAGVFGNPGQCDYAFANAFTDSFAEYRQALVAKGERHGRTLSINWPLWKSGGMHIDAKTEQMLFQSVGLKPLKTETGLQALINGLAEERSVFGVMSGDVQKLTTTFQLAAPVQAPVVQAKVSGASEHDGASEKPVAADLPTASQDTALKEKTLSYLRTVLATETKIDAAEIKNNEALERYGIDSVMIVSLTAQLEKQFGELPKTLFFEVQTLNELSEYLQQHHAAVLQSLFGKAEAVQRPRVEPRTSSVSTIPSRFTHKSRFGLSREEHQEIAIIGVSGRYPMAADIDDYWE